MKIRILTSVAAVCCAAGFFPNAEAFAQQQKTADAEILITGIKSARGNILIGIPGNSAGPASPAMQGTMVKAEKGSVTAALKGLRAGETAIYIFQDINGNYQLDRNEKGVPAEPCCILKTVLKEGSNKATATLETIKRKK